MSAKSRFRPRITFRYGVPSSLILNQHAYQYQSISNSCPVIKDMKKTRLLFFG
jgi:hypothetical protein